MAVHAGDDRIKIVIADANPHMRRITEGYLRASPQWEIKTDETIDQVFTDICFWEPKIVVCTERLADGSIQQLLRKCREAGDSLPPFGLIATIARPSREAVIALRKEGCPMILRSPFSRSELEARLAFVMHHLATKGTMMRFADDDEANGALNRLVNMVQGKP